MAHYLMLGKYSAEGAKGITAQRSKKAADLVAGLGGKIISVHGLLGAHDLVILADLPDNARALKASIELGKLCGLVFSTSPAVPADEFDKIATS